MSRSCSRSERSFIQEGCDLGLRYDGRDPNGFRSIKIENSVLPHVNGSSRVTIDGSSDILCSVKLEIVQPVQSLPDSGTLVVNVDISPSCEIYEDDRVLQSYGVKIAEELQRILLSSGGIDLKQFGILKGLYCWAVHVDLMVLALDGNPVDICSIAAYVALACTTIPATEPIPGESGLMEDFDVTGDVSQGALVQVASFPLLVTLAKVGEALLVDSSAQEQECASCIATIAYDRQGNCCGTTFQKPGMMSLAELALCQDKASSVASAMFKHLDTLGEKKKTDTTSTGRDTLHQDMPQMRLGLLL